VVNPGHAEGQPQQGQRGEKPHAPINAAASRGLTRRMYAAISCTTSRVFIASTCTSGAVQEVRYKHSNPRKQYELRQSNTCVGQAGVGWFEQSKQRARARAGSGGALG
jgi:hypothetical protein